VPLSTVNEDQPGSIAGISVSDVDVGETPLSGGRLEVTLRVNQGVLSVATGVSGGLTVNDIANNGTAIVTILSAPAQINATLAATGGLAYLSALNFNGADALVVTVSDGGQTGIFNPLSPSTVNRTVTVNVQPINDPPQVTVPGTLTLAEDASANLGAITVSDVDAGETAGATLRVTLTVDHGVLLVNTGIPGGLTAGNVSANSSRSVTLTGTLAALNATLTHSAGVLYRPTQDFNGTDTVSIMVDDRGNTGQPGAQTANGTFAITVTPVNDTPVAINDPGLGDPPFIVDENTVLSVAGRGMLDNDYDVDGDVLSVVIDGVTPVAGKYHITSLRGAPVVIDAAQGTFTFDPTGVVAFQQLTTGQTLTDLFMYRAWDGQLSSNLGTVTITVTGVNDPPVGGADFYTTPDSSPLSSFQNQAVPGLLANDYDPENQPISVVVASSDTVSRLGATVTIQTNGEFVYDPRTSLTLAPMRPGDPPITDSFTYVVADSSGLWTMATVTVTVTGANSAPLAVSDQYATVENVVLVVPAAGVLANDTDPDSASISAVAGSITSQYGATIQMNADGGFTYNPLASSTLRALETGQTLTDTFSYQVRDDEGATAVGIVTIMVDGFSDPPFQNAANPFDVNGDGNISPIDPLILINYINANGQGPIPAGRVRPPYLDVNGDSNATAEDVIMVVNRLNTLASGEGEADAEAMPGQIWTPAAPIDAVPLGMSPAEPTTAERLGAPIAAGLVGSGSTGRDLSPWSGAATGEERTESISPLRSVFDAWDAEDGDLEAALVAISRGAGSADREAATDALLGDLFG